MDKKFFANLMVRTGQAIRKFAPDFSDRAILAAWYDDLKHLSHNDLEAACDFARKNLDEFPSLAWFLRKSHGLTRSFDEIGQDIATRIEKAIGMFGYTQPGRAEQYIGEMGWLVVQQCGGWGYIAGSANSDGIPIKELPMARKQWREMGAIVSKNMHETGECKPQGRLSGTTEPSAALHYLEIEKAMQKAISEPEVI